MKSEVSRLAAGYGAIMRELFGGETPGAIFVNTIFQVLHIYDDLVDRDKELPEEDIHRVFWMALFDLPLDPFYRKHEPLLRPVLMNSILNWKVANLMERKSPEKRHLGIAWILRGSYIDLISMALACERGLDYAVNAGQLLRDWAHSETFEVYLTNLKQEQEARDVRLRPQSSGPNSDSERPSSGESVNR